MPYVILYQHFIPTDHPGPLLGYYSEHFFALRIKFPGVVAFTLEGIHGSVEALRNVRDYFHSKGIRGCALRRNSENIFLHVPHEEVIACMHDLYHEQQTEREKRFMRWMSDQKICKASLQSPFFSSDYIILTFSSREDRDRYLDNAADDIVLANRDTSRILEPENEAFLGALKKYLQTLRSDNLSVKLKIPNETGIEKFILKMREGTVLYDVQQLVEDHNIRKLTGSFTPGEIFAAFGLIPPDALLLTPDLILLPESSVYDPYPHPESPYPQPILTVVAEGSTLEPSAPEKVTLYYLGIFSQTRQTSSAVTTSQEKEKPTISFGR